MTQYNDLLNTILSGLPTFTYSAFRLSVSVRSVLRVAGAKAARLYAVLSRPRIFSQLL